MRSFYLSMTVIKRMTATMQL